MEKRRVHLLDEIRGLAVFCMIFYHLFYVLGYSCGVPLMAEAEAFFSPFQPPFACIFIFISGISSRLSRSNFKRGIKLLAVALVLSAVTVFLLPMLGFSEAQVRFGILHLLSVSMLIFAAVRPLFEKIPTGVGLAVFFVLYLFTFGVDSGYLGITPALGIPLPDSFYRFSLLAPLGFAPESFFSADWFPLLPNFFMFAAGTFFGKFVVEGKIPESAYKLRCRFLSWFGRHALIIYLAHWPFIFIIGLIIEKI